MEDPCERLGSEERCRAAMAAAGFVDVQVRRGDGGASRGVRGVTTQHMLNVVTPCTFAGPPVRHAPLHPLPRPPRTYKHTHIHTHTHTRTHTHTHARFVPFVLC